MTVAFRDGDDIRALNVANHFSFGVALFVPDEELRTVDARTLLPAKVAHEDAVFNASRAAFLTTALLWGKWDEIGSAMDDRLHQPYRAALIPALPDVIAAARDAGAYGAALSGGGPSVIAIGPRESIHVVARAMEETARQHNWKGDALLTGVRHLGAQVVPAE
jgi:homoserine kinase